MRLEKGQKLITRAIKLALSPRYGKGEDARYTCKRFKLFAQHFVTQLYFNHNEKMFLSTKGMGQLANKAQHRACGLLRAHRAATEETGNKSNLPVISKANCPAKIEKSKTSSFDFWVKVESQFGKYRQAVIPAKSHKRLNYWLKKGYELNEVCEIFQDKNQKFYVRVFVQRVVDRAKPTEKTLGVDVGYRNSVARSDGYIGKNTAKIIKKQRLKQSERQRQNALGQQNNRKISVKTELKQLLDIEAQRAVRVARAARLSLVVEDPKILANLSSGKLQGWARAYFANRCFVIGEETGVFVWAVNPAHTSVTCSNCHSVDKRSRVKSTFRCTACNSVFHADVNAAKNIARKGLVSLSKILSKDKKDKQSGTINQTGLCGTGRAA